MSRLPWAGTLPSNSPILCARRDAIGTPRRRIPTRPRSSTPLLRSTISWAIRVMIRRRPSASTISAFSLSTMSPPGASHWLPCARARPRGGARSPAERYRAARPPASCDGRLLHHRHLDRPRPPEHVDTDVVFVPLDDEVDRGLPYPQMAEAHHFQERRQGRLAEAHARARAVDREPEARLEQHEGRPGRPGLRRARHRVERRPLAGAAVDAAEQRGQAVLVHEYADVEQPG